MSLYIATPVSLRTWKRYSMLVWGFRYTMSPRSLSLFLSLSLTLSLSLSLSLSLWKWCFTRKCFLPTTPFSQFSIILLGCQWGWYSLSLSLSLAAMMNSSEPFLENNHFDEIHSGKPQHPYSQPLFLKTYKTSLCCCSSTTTTMKGVVGEGVQ